MHGRRTEPVHVIARQRAIPVASLQQNPGGQRRGHATGAAPDRSGPNDANAARESESRVIKLLPLDNPALIDLVAEWLGREENNKWLDFGNGIGAPSAVALKIMTQRDLHVLRVFTPDGSDLPIGVVGLSNVDRRFKSAGSLWAVLGNKRYGGFARRAASKLLTHGFRELGLEVIGAWAVAVNVASRRALEQLHFRYVGRQRRCHWIDGQPQDRLLYDLLATEHEDLPDD